MKANHTVFTGSTTYNLESGNIINVLAHTKSRMLNKMLVQRIQNKFKRLAFSFYSSEDFSLWTAIRVIATNNYCKKFWHFWIFSTSMHHKMGVIQTQEYVKLTEYLSKHVDGQSNTSHVVYKHERLYWEWWTIAHQLGTNSQKRQVQSR